MALDLFPFQEIGGEWLAEKKYALLADEMGLGKTCQAIRGCDLLYAKSILVVCPPVARRNWVEEFSKFSFVPRDAFIAYKGLTETPRADIVVVSYDLAVDGLQHLMGRKWEVLICDEAHFLKNRKAKRTKAILGLGRKGGNYKCLQQVADKVWLLSGTPAPNNVSELWPMMVSGGFTDRSFFDFVKRFCSFYETAYGLQITGNKNLHELRLQLELFMLRRKKDDPIVNLQLPPLFFNEVVIDPGEVDLAAYFPDINHSRPMDVDPDFATKIERQENALSLVLDSAGSSRTPDSERPLGALWGSIGTLRKYHGLQKVKPVAELIKADLEAGVEKVVVFCYHTKVIEWFDHELRGYEPAIIYGGTEPKRREARMKKFWNPRGRCRVFLGQVLACGTAIDLTIADTIYVVEADWVPANNAQAVMRCHRITQKRPVNVKWIMLKNSIDHRINKILKNKTRMLTQLFD